MRYLVNFFPVKSLAVTGKLFIFAPVLRKPAEIAQLVEHNLAKVRVASSSLVFRSPFLRMLEWWNGRHEGLKILWPVMAVRVQVPLRVQIGMLITLLLSD